MGGGTGIPWRGCGVGWARARSHVAPLSAGPGNPVIRLLPGALGKASNVTSFPAFASARHTKSSPIGNGTAGH